MKRTEVASSMIRSVGYDPDARVLEIEFNSGQVYQYFDVPPEKHEGLMQAGSHGRYFLANIRDVYRYRRISKGSSRTAPTTSAGGKRKASGRAAGLDTPRWIGRDSNPQPRRYERPALTVELPIRERETGLEPATSTLEEWHSTAELLPPVGASGLEPLTS